MASDPKIDGRDSEDIVDHVESITPNYIEKWDPDAEDVGSVLGELFGDMAGSLVSRLDRVPEKYRYSFLSSLGFQRHPARPARLPLAIEVAERAPGNVAIPTGTTALAESDDGDELVFTIEEGFEATPSNLVNAYSVDPETDTILEHTAAIDDPTVVPSSADQALFDAIDGENQQRHALLIGDEDRLHVGPDISLSIRLKTTSAPGTIVENLRWEYTDEPTNGAESAWRPFDTVQVDVESILARLSSADRDAFPDDWNDDRALANWLDRVGLTLPADRRESTEDRQNSSESPIRDFLLAVHHAVGDYPAAREDPDDTVRVFLTPNEPIKAITLDGIESRWVRCVLPRSAGHPDDYGIEIGDDKSTGITVGSTPASDEFILDALLANDVPLSTDPSPGESALKPFGDHPRRRDALYLASETVFSKGGTTATVRFEGDGVEDSTETDPVLSWEYFDGDGWKRIPDLDDGTDAFQKGSDGGPSCDVHFDVPDDLDATSVHGHEGYWIRVRFVGGDYGPVSIPDSDATEWTPGIGDDPPHYDRVTLRYSDLAEPAHVISENNLTYCDQNAEQGRFRPFVGPPDDQQTLYLGFDGHLTDGAIPLLVVPTDRSYEETFDPGVRWEFFADTESAQWIRPDVIDESSGLTERGVVSLSFPQKTASAERFGRDRHWIRARVTRDRFEAETNDGAISARQDPDGTEDGEPTGVFLPCRRTIATGPPGGMPATHFPELRAIVPNAGWAANRQTIEAEIVGESDGSADQTYALAETPVTDVDVWIDETSTIITDEQTELAKQSPERIRIVGDDPRDPVAVWVRWDQHEDLLTATPTDRHYTLDPVEGTIAFGDDDRGAIPPPGEDNIRVSYTTGGGASGNVPVGAVDGFRRSINFIEGVTNPLSGDGGSDAESLASVGERAPGTLRDRDRAVTAADIESIAMRTSRGLARVRCLPGMDDSGEETPGWVTVLIVPDEDGVEPIPSTTLRRQVERDLLERAPLTLEKAEQLVVRGPSYVPVSVDATLVRADTGSLTALEDATERAMMTFLDPLDGGPAGNGWPFGRLPCLADVYTHLESVDGVDHVVDLIVRVTDADGIVHEIGDGDAVPLAPPDLLVSSGNHTIDASFSRPSQTGEAN